MIDGEKYVFEKTDVRGKFKNWSQDGNIDF